MYIYVYSSNQFKKKEVINLKENVEGYIGGFGVKKGKEWGMLQLYEILKNVNMLQFSVFQKVLIRIIDKNMRFNNCLIL